MSYEFKFCKIDFDCDLASEFGTDLQNRLMDFVTSKPDISLDDYYSISTILAYWNAQLDIYYVTRGGTKND